MNTAPKKHFITRLILLGVGVFAVASCGASNSSSNEVLVPGTGAVKAKSFCATATSASKVELGMGDGKSDAIKLYYANQVVGATSLAAVAPQDIKVEAENLRLASVEIFKIFEKYGFDINKVQQNGDAMKLIQGYAVQYKLEQSDAKMKKYLLDKCGISGQSQSVPTTVAQ